MAQYTESLFSRWRAYRTQQCRKNLLLEKLCRNGISYFVLVTFAYFLIGHLVPSLIHYCLLAAAVVILLSRFLTFNRWEHELPHSPAFFLALVIALVELVIENFLVWVVAALDENKYQHTPALQDNILKYLTPVAQVSPVARNLLYYPYADAFKFLFWAIAFPLSVLWNQVPYSGFAMMTRYLLTLAVSRSIRVVCFLSTILPSPRPGCYMRRFPPVPSDTWEFVAVGFTKMRGFGGCNDLVFSGHGAFWTLTLLLFGSYYRGQGAAGKAAYLLLLLLLIQTSVRDVMDRQHYSVDMVLAPVVTSAVWTWLEWVCPPAMIIASLHDERGAQRTPFAIVVLIFASIVIGAIIIVVGKA